MAEAANRGAIDAILRAARHRWSCRTLLDIDVDELDRVMAVNARGTFLGMKYAIPHMRDGGAIVNVASVSGIAGDPAVAALGASKHAVIGLTRTAALAGAARGIRVNAICPGPIEGSLMAAAAGRATYAQDEDPFLRGIPLRRYGTPHKVAEAIYILAVTDGRFHLRRDNRNRRRPYRFAHLTLRASHENWRRDYELAFGFSAWYIA